MTRDCNCHNPRHYCDACRKHLPESYITLHWRRIGSMLSGTDGRYCDLSCLNKDLELAKTVSQRRVPRETTTWSQPEN